jgi:predicted amidohydrolase
VRRSLAVLAGLGGASAAFVGWSVTGRRPPREEVKPELEANATFGDDVGAGNLLAVQAHVTASDYASGDRLQEKLARYLEAAQEAGQLTAKTIVVFPEHIGTWFFAAYEKTKVYTAPTMERASALVVATNLPSFLPYLLKAKADDRAGDALFRMKAEVMAAAYQGVFSRLASRFGCTVVAGSIWLPRPEVVDGQLLLGDGPLEEVSLVFGSNGRPLGPPVRRSFLGVEERGLIEAGDPADLPTFATPAGRLGVLLGRDAFQPVAHGRLHEQGVDLLAVPAYLPGEQRWTSTWSGFVGTEHPPDVPADDVGRLMEAEAWLQHGPAGRLHQCGARAQVTSFLKGNTWERPGDGAVLATCDGKTQPGPLVRGASWVSQQLSTTD